MCSVQFISGQSLSHVQLFVTPWTAAQQASLSITNSWSLFKLMCIESVMKSNHLILCHPLLLLHSIFPSIRVFSNESVHIRWPKYWSSSFSISPSKGYSRLISFRIDWLDLFAVQGTLRLFSVPQCKSINYLALTFLYGPTLISIHFLHSLAGKESTYTAGDPGSILGSEISPGEGISYTLQYSWGFLVTQMVKNLPAVHGTWVRSLGWDYHLENGTATHSRILAWRIPWTV